MRVTAKMLEADGWEKVECASRLVGIDLSARSKWKKFSWWVHPESPRKIHTFHEAAAIYKKEQNDAR